VENVRKNGDAALFAYTERFDGWTERWNDTLSQTIAHVSGFLDGLGRMDLS
jgi:histidinol dehydrogenase